jgi:hypothetical protein
MTAGHGSLDAAGRPAARSAMICAEPVARVKSKAPWPTFRLQSGSARVSASWSGWQVVARSKVRSEDSRTWRGRTWRGRLAVPPAPGATAGLINRIVPADQIGHAGDKKLIPRLPAKRQWVPQRHRRSLVGNISIEWQQRRRRDAHRTSFATEATAPTQQPPGV